MYYLGLDLGQRRDPSAIAVVERGRDERLMVRHLERIPLGTSYPRVVARVKKLLALNELRGNCWVAADATGVGAPVMDMLRDARLGCDVASVTITSGEKESQSGQTWNVPKRDLIAGLQVLLERDQLRIAEKLRDAGPLMRELMNVRTRRKENGRERLGADGYGERDDLVVALALACWRAGKAVVRYGESPRRFRTG
jgi:hypothetical protein